MKNSEITFFSLVSGKKIKKLCPQLENNSVFANDVCKFIVDEINILSMNYTDKRFVIIGDLGCGVTMMAKNLAIMLDGQGYLKLKREEFDELFDKKGYEIAQNSLTEHGLFFKHEKNSFQIARTIDDFQ